MILNHNRIAIVGYAATGKTRCSDLFVDREVFHSDDYIETERDLVQELRDSDRYVAEGVRILTLLRDYLDDVGLVIRLEPKFEARPKHRTQRKAIDTVWKQWLAQGPSCRIMCVNEDVLEFMVEQEKAIWERQVYLDKLDAISPYSKRLGLDEIPQPSIRGLGHPADLAISPDWRKNSIG